VEPAVEAVIEVLFRNSADRSEAAAAGIRVDDVEPAFFAFDLCEELVQVIEIRGVGFDGRNVAAHKLRGCIQLGLSPTGNEDVCFFLDETLRSGKADSGRAACDKRDLSFKFS
jgi:hypothetical protein